MDGRLVSDWQSDSDLDSEQSSQFLSFAANLMLILNRKKVMMVFLYIIVIICLLEVGQEDWGDAAETKLKSMLPREEVATCHIMGQPCPQSKDLKGGQHSLLTSVSVKYKVIAILEYV